MSVSTTGVVGASLGVALAGSKFSSRGSTLRLSGSLSGRGTATTFSPVLTSRASGDRRSCCLWT